MRRKWMNVRDTIAAHTKNDVARRSIDEAMTQSESKKSLSGPVVYSICRIRREFVATL
jgi:hypothetical protein